MVWELPSRLSTVSGVVSSCDTFPMNAARACSSCASRSGEVIQGGDEGVAAAVTLAADRVADHAGLHSRYPTPHTFAIQQSSECRASFWRNRLAWESSVRVLPGEEMERAKRRRNGSVVRALAAGCARHWTCSDKAGEGGVPRRWDRCDDSTVKVLVVEDEDALAVSLVKGLAREGFEVTRAATGEAALAEHEGDVVLLDLRLPDMDGLDVCRAIRARSAVPIIIISARGEEVDRVVGLELGADDYIVKPFGFREVVARIRAVKRRAVQPPESREPFTVGPLTVDVRTRRVTLDGGDVVLTPKEFDLLALLAADAGAVVTRNQILHEVWQTDWYGPTKTIDVHVASLRRKLGDQRWIETLRGVGFRLVAPE